jgi:MFS family permease
MVTAQAGGARALAAFEHRDFRLYQAARLCTTVGLQMQGVAIGWQIYSTTRDPLDLGYVGLAEFMPAIVFALFTGHAADRLNRRRVLLACQSLLALCSLALLALSQAHDISIRWAYLVLVFVGTARAFAGPASAALMPNLVPPAHFANAVAWSSSIWQLATIVGPALGGLLYGLMGGATPVYMICATLACGALGFTFAVRPPVQVPEAGAASFERLIAGVRYVWRNKIILGSISLDLFAVLLGGVVALLPVFAHDILHVGPTGMGALRSAPGVGAAVVAVVLAFRPLERSPGKVMLACVAMYGLSIIAFGLSRSFVLSLFVLFVAGASDMISVFVRHTVVQLTTPDAMRGRVSAVNLVFIGASNELGEFESGVTAAWLGTVPAVVAGGVGTCAIVLLCAALFPELRKIERLSDLRS